jgi:hypothetical protein
VPRSAGLGWARWARAGLGSAGGSLGRHRGKGPRACGALPLRRLPASQHSRQTPSLLQESLLASLDGVLGSGSLARRLAAMTGIGRRIRTRTQPPQTAPTATHITQAIPFHPKNTPPTWRVLAVATAHAGHEDKLLHALLDGCIDNVDVAFAVNAGVRNRTAQRAHNSVDLLDACAVPRVNLGDVLHPAGANAAPLGALAQGSPRLATGLKAPSGSAAPTTHTS